MSALPPKADIGTQRRDVRFVPKADSCTAAKCVASFRLIYRGGLSPIYSQVRPIDVVGQRARDEGHKVRHFLDPAKSFNSFVAQHVLKPAALDYLPIVAPSEALSGLA